VWYKNVGTSFFRFVTNRAFDRLPDGRTEGQQSHGYTVRGITCSRTVETTCDGILHTYSVVPTCCITCIVFSLQDDTVAARLPLSAACLKCSASTGYRHTWFFGSDFSKSSDFSNLLTAANFCIISLVCNTTQMQPVSYVSLTSSDQPVGLCR